MTWIKVEHDTPTKPEVFRLARLLGVSRHDAFGKVVIFWSWLDGVSVDGLVDGVAPQDIDALVDTEGFCDALDSIGWLNVDAEGERINVPNFHRHNGETAKKRAQKAKRQAKWRASVDAPVDASVDGAASTKAPPEKRREEKKNKNIDLRSMTQQPDNGQMFVFALQSGTWSLPEQKLAEYRATYGFDVTSELRKAAQWLRDNKSRRPKTGRGCAAFLTRWLNRVDERRGQGAKNKTPAEMVASLFEKDNSDERK